MPLNFLITGAARGIGRGLSRLLLQKGHRVFLVDNNTTEIEHLRKTLPKLFPDNPSRFHIQHCDLLKPSDITEATTTAAKFFSNRLDVLINNAFCGPVGQTSFSELSLEEWSRIINTNLTGSMLMTQACLPMLKKSSLADRSSGGSVIMMSSTRAHQSEPNSEGYATTKAGLIGLTHALACSLAEEFISVNAILPGWIHVLDECKEADEKGRKWEEGLGEADQKWHWTGRVGKAEDILRAVEYLVDAKEFVTGQEIVVDGGVTRRMVYPEE